MFRRNKFSWFLLVFIAALVVGDFVAAPLTAVGAVKAAIGERLVIRDLSAIYSKGGLKAVESRCKGPIEKMGFFYTCDTEISTLYDWVKPPMHQESIWIYRFSDKNPARDSSSGLTLFNPDFPSDPGVTRKVWRVAEVSHEVLLATWPEKRK